MFGWQIVLAAVAVLFLAFLVWQMRPGSTMGLRPAEPGSAPYPGGRQRSAVGADVRAARARASAATSPRARAEALCEAGALAAQGRGRWTAAAGSFLRAMNADPTWTGAVEQLVAALRRRRPRLLEKILWRRLGHLPWDDAHRAVLLAITAGLRQLYEKERRNASHAAVFRRLEATFQPR